MEGIRNNSFADGLRAEHVLLLGESLQHKRCQVPILPEQQQILFVQGVNDVFRIMLHDIWIGKNRDPIAGVALMRYMVKQPGKQVTPPNIDSNALVMWCKM